MHHHNGLVHYPLSGVAVHHADGETAPESHAAQEVQWTSPAP
jgi:hypothetical protein